jgi:Ribbon-helix-helix protein, copG family
MADGVRITVRLGSAQLAKLDAIAGAAGISRSLALRRLLDGAGAAAPAPLDRDDLIGLLEERARAGSAPAIRELLGRKEQDEQLERLRSLTTD